MTPDGKTFDPETVTDKQLVQYEQAIDRGLTEADAMRLTEHEYNGFQANAIIAAALNPAVGEDVLDALATPKYTAAQMTAIAKIAIRGGDFARFLDPQMDARRMLSSFGYRANHAKYTHPECLPYPPDLNRNAWRYRENRKRQPHCRGLLQGFPYCHPGN